MHRQPIVSRISARVAIAAKAISLSIATLLTSLPFAAATHADVVELAGGGRLEGKLLPTDETNKSTYTIDLATGGRVTIARSQVTKIDPITADEAEYQKLARSSPDTVDAHWKLAEWCRDHKLRGQRQRHLERILELDPNHAQARSALGFQQRNGEWMNRDDVMAARGMVLYDGRYVTPQQVELLEQQKDSRVTQADWRNRIEQLRRSLTGRRQERSAQALTEIRSIRDPQAADAIVEVLRRESAPDLKRLWIEVASQIDSRATIDALVHLSLVDQDDDIRHLSLEYLIKSGRPGLATPYIRSLKDKDNVIINRAGAALGQIGDRDAIGPLIDALITKHKVKISDANPDQHAYTFSKDGGGFSFGGSAPQAIVQPMRNPAVLDSLVKLAGTSFDYDQVQWRGWLAAQAKATAIDVRRDP
jgi:PBS lyase HEAT-like repeat